MGRAATVTILFTDLVGSTALATGIGDDAMDRVRREHFAGLREQLGSTGGREVKTIGDAVMAVYQSTADAVGGAIAMQQAVGRMNRRSAGVALQMRIGMSSGDVVEEGDDWFGTPVNEAARLCSAAVGGQILVADVVRVLTGSRGGHEFRSIGQLELKGLAEPVQTYEVTWDQPESLPLPPALATITRSTLIGRDAEVSRLMAAWDAWARSGRGVRFASISGEPGIGKTRLAAEVATRAGAEGALVLFGRCDETVTAPFRPIVQALGPVIDSDRGVARSAGAELVRLFPRLRDELGAPTEADPQTERLWLFESIERLLGASMSLGPQLLVLDDLHWADEPTLLLLRHLLTSTADIDLFVVGTYREHELSPEHRLTRTLAGLHRGQRPLRITLEGLSIVSTASLIAAMTEATPTDDLARAVHTETEGSPFFVEEVVALLVESGEVRVENGVAAGTSGTIEVRVPEGVRDVIRRRLSRLSEAANEVLTVAAVIGREFDLDVVRTACGVEPAPAIEALAEAVDVRLIDELPGPRLVYGFAHALIRSALLGDLSNSRRTLAHAKIGHALEAVFSSRDDHIAELALHFGAAAMAGEAPRAYDYSVAAAERARESGAPEESFGFYATALAALDVIGDPNDRRRCDVLTKQADLAYMLDRREEALDAATEAISLARERGWGEELARASTLSISFLGGQDTNARAREVLALALELLPADAVELRSELLSFRAYNGYDAPNGNPDSMLLDSLSAEALELAHGLPNTLPFTRALMSRCLWYDIAGRTDDMLDAAREAAALDRRDGRTYQALFSDLRVLFALLRLGRRREVDELIEQYEIPQLAATAWATHALPRWRAMLLLATGRLDEAEIAARARRAPPGVFDAVKFDQLLAIRWARGQVDAVMDRLVPAVAFADEYPILPLQHATYASALGDLDEAAVFVDQLDDDAVARLLRGNQYQRAARLLAELAFYHRHGGLAAILEPYLAPHEGTMFIGYAESTVEGAAAASLAHVEATLGRYDDAERHYQAALDLETAFGGHALLPETRTFYARSLRRRDHPGDHARAEALLQRAFTDAHDLGMTRCADVAASLL